MFSIRQLGAINRTYRHLNRYQRILRVLFKYGFSDLVDRLHIDQYLETGLQMINRKPREQLDRHTRPARLRMALEELGPTFIKLGQLLSTRPDFIPPEYLSELAKLQDSVPPFSYQEVQQIFLEECGQDPEEVFEYFDSIPLAAASIGQVHQARLLTGQHQTGGGRSREVVVKVQRPGIENLIAIDLEILAHLAHLMEEHLEEVQGHRPSSIVDEFARSLSREIDFTIELANIQRFSRQFEGNTSIHVPDVYPQLSTERLLVLELVDGIKASDVETLKERGYDLPLIAERGANLVMEQIFVHGFFHADPHPGNIFIMPDNVICFIDFGQMGRLSLKDREDFADLVLNLVSADAGKVAAGVLKVTSQQGTLDQDALELDIGDFMDRYLYLSLGELKAGKILQDLLELVSRHKLSLKPNLYLMLKAMTTVEGVGLLLDPDIQLINLARPFLKRIKVGQIKPTRLAKEVGETGMEYLALLRDLPDEARSIISQLRRGKMKLEFEHRGLRALENSLDRASNRIAFAIVLAAQIIGSSLIIRSDIPPHWHGIPVVGLAGFLLAGVMGFWLLISIIRHGKM
ncbi:MAG: AarF/ABC1/UbiB kinase family protein [Desulfobulbus sp.]|nr:MAG: AarF/ABC1/UbiB kinase family protein [Desulfobulbus sp.]